MEKLKKIWKKIEHWLVIAIFLYMTVGQLIMYLFAEELGLVRMPSVNDSPHPGVYFGKCGNVEC